MSGETRRLDGRLRLEWLVFVGATAVFAAVGARLVSDAAGEAAGWRWLAGLGVVLAYQAAFLSYHLGRLGWTNEPPQDSFGTANAVTLLRGLLFAAVGGFLLVPPTTPLIRWAPGLCYGAGAALDLVDGHVARRNGRTSELGRRLDHAFDTLGFLLAPLVGVAWGRLPVWYLSLSAARYVFRAGRAWRRRSDRPVHPLPESRLRRWLAAFQMAFIAVALLPVLPVGIVHPAAAVALAPSLAWFLRDWLVVSGRLPRREE